MPPARGVVVGAQVLARQGRVRRVGVGVGALGVGGPPRLRPRGGARGQLAAPSAVPLAARILARIALFGGGHDRGPLVLAHQARNDSGGGAGASRVSVQPFSGGGSRLIRPDLATSLPPRDAGTLGRGEQPGRAEHPAGQLEDRSFGRNGLFSLGVDDLGAQVDQRLGDVDRDRAHLVAGAAQGGGVGQGRVGRGGDAAQQRGDDRADRARVGRAVGVAAGPLVDRAHVQAGRAPDAAQRLPAGLVGQRRRAAVVQQHQVEVLRPVAGRDPGPGRGVGVHPLGGGGPGQQREEHLQVPPGRQDLLDPDHRDERARQRHAHPAVALGFHHHQRPGLGDREVRAGYAHRRGQERLAQVRPRGGRERGRVVGQARPARPASRAGRSP